MHQFSMRLPVILLISALLSSCNAVPGKDIFNQFLPSPTSQPIPTEIENSIPSPIPPSPVVEELPTEEPPTLEPTFNPSPTHQETPDVIHITFPTPGVQPISIWRPPLYPVPWALDLHDHFLFVRPVAADVVNWPLPSYRYGGTFTDTDIVHTGIDIDAPLDTPVYAVGSGIIRWAGYGLYLNNTDKNDPYGLAVAIEHDFGYNGQKLYTIYAHLDRVDVFKGQKVDAATQIGIVGNTGNTTGPHLHFEVRLGSNDYYSSRNPELWLSPPQGWGVLVGRIMWSDGTLLQKKTVTVRSLDSDQHWEVVTYGPLAVQSDDYYKENLVLSDLPQGQYEVSVTFYGLKYKQVISIQPGAVTYLSFRGTKGFSIAPPPTPEPSEWLILPTPTP